MTAATTFVHCCNCNRGGRGNDADKCACGWQITEPDDRGCYMGCPIVGTPVKPPKLSRAKRRYQAYLRVSDAFESFADYLRHAERGGNDGK